MSGTSDTGKVRIEPKPEKGSVGAFLQRIKPDTTVDLHFASSGFGIPEQLQEPRQTAKTLCDNEYIVTRLIHERRHFVDPGQRITSGWDVYIDEPFDEQRFMKAQAAAA